MTRLAQSSLLTQRLRFIYATQSCQVSTCLDAEPGGTRSDPEGYPYALHLSYRLGLLWSSPSRRQLKCRGPNRGYHVMCETVNVFLFLLMTGENYTMLEPHQYALCRNTKSWSSIGCNFYACIRDKQVMHNLTSVDLNGGQTSRAEQTMVTRIIEPISS